MDEAEACRELQDKVLNDSTRGPCTIPMRLKLAGTLVWLRSGSTNKFVAELACDIGENTLRRFKTSCSEVTHMHYLLIDIPACPQRLERQGLDSGA